MKSVECEIVLLFEFDFGALAALVQDVVAPYVNCQRRFHFTVHELRRQFELKHSALLQKYFNTVVWLDHYKSSCRLTHHDSLHSNQPLVPRIDHFNHSARKVSLRNLRAQCCLN